MDYPRTHRHIWLQTNPCLSIRLHRRPDGLQLSAHSFMFNKNAIELYYRDLQNEERGIADFQSRALFSVKSVDLQNPREELQDVGTDFVNYWGRGHDCELKFSVRTGSDSHAKMIDLLIRIPNHGFKTFIYVSMYYDPVAYQVFYGSIIWVKYLVDRAQNDHANIVPTCAYCVSRSPTSDVLGGMGRRNASSGRPPVLDITRYRRRRIHKND